MKRYLLGWFFTLGLVTAAFGQAVQTWSYWNITAAAPTTLKSTPGVLHCVAFNKPVATAVVTIYDNTAGSGTKIGAVTVPSSPQPVTLCYDVAFWTGLTIVTATAASDITVSFR